MPNLPTSCNGCQHAIDAGHPDDMIEVLARYDRRLPLAITRICTDCTVWDNKTDPRDRFEPACPTQPRPSTNSWSKWSTDE